MCIGNKENFFFVYFSYKCTTCARICILHVYRIMYMYKKIILIIIIMGNNNNNKLNSYYTLQYPGYQKTVNFSVELICISSYIFSII